MTILLTQRIGGPKNTPLLWGDGVDEVIFGDFVCYGFFFIACVQVLGTLLGDRQPKVQNFLVALFGFGCWLALGSIVIHDADAFIVKETQKKMRAIGSLGIINSVIYLADAALQAFQKDDDDS